MAGHRLGLLSQRPNANPEMPGFQDLLPDYLRSLKRVMLSLARPLVRRSNLSQSSNFCRVYRERKIPEPLRILFCGSDGVSVESLNALNKEHKQDPNLIQSIDVVCKAPRPVGRGLKNIRHGMPKTNI